MFKSEVCGQRQGRESRSREMRWNIGTNRYEIEPKKLEENCDIETGSNITCKKRPKQPNDKGALKKANTQREAEERKEGKKKAIRANQRYELDISISRTSPEQGHWVHT